MKRPTFEIYRNRSVRLGRFLQRHQNVISGLVLCVFVLVVVAGMVGFFQPVTK